MLKIDDILRSIEHRDTLKMVGSAGYSLPPLDDYIFCRIDSICNNNAVDNVNIIGSVNSMTGYIVMHKEHRLRSVLTINCFPSARNALVVIGRDCTLHGVVSIYSENATVILVGGTPSVGHSGSFAAQLWSNNNMLYVGLASTTNGSSYVIGGENRSIIIGDDCMFAHNITLRTTDMHAVFDMTTGMTLNSPGDIVLEPHVWLSQGVVVSKGVVIGLGSVVGAQSLVLKGCARFNVIGGVPAKVISEGRSWDRHANPRPDTLERLKELARTVRPFALPS